MHIKGAAVGAVYDKRRISFGCPMKPTPAWLPYAFVGGLLLLFLTLSVTVERPVQDVPYSRFKQLVAEGEVEEVLGANEAPPAIISIYLGDQLNDIIEQIKTGKKNKSSSEELLKAPCPFL